MSSVPTRRPAGFAQSFDGRRVDRYDDRKLLIAFLLVSARCAVILAAIVLPTVERFLVLSLVGASPWGIKPAAIR